jgi:hypothetical protein
VVKIRKFNVCSVFLACAVACEGARPVAPTATELPDAGRHPDGVLVETPAALPSPVVRAEARGVVALREPLGVEAVHEVVLALVQAVQSEDLPAFEQLLLPECATIETGAVRGSRVVIVERFRRRMRELDFSRLAGVELVRTDHIQHFEFEELESQREIARPPSMRPGDILVRFPIENARLGADRYFGDTWTLVLRRVEGTRKYRVAAFGESEAPTP